MTNEQISKAKECKSAEELLALAKENGIEMTAEEAEAKFAQLNNEGELSDDELSGAAGGGCGGGEDPEMQQYFRITEEDYCNSDWRCKYCDERELQWDPFNAHYEHRCSVTKIWKFIECVDCKHYVAGNGKKGYCTIRPR